MSVNKKSRLRQCVLWLLAASACAAQTSAWAWGPEGHRIVAALAQRQLNPQAAAEVAHLLALDHVQQLADVASWPDEIQDDPKQAELWHQTQRLHYINFGSEACQFVASRDCADGQCVVAGLDHYLTQLANPQLPDPARLQALKFVVHFVGDAHQPLHDGYRHDKGGNTYQVQFAGQGRHLHQVWDSGLLGTRHLSWQAYAARLYAEGPVTLPVDQATGLARYAQWSEAACRITRDQGVYPKGHVIDARYVNAELPIAEQQLRVAGARLAELLNANLGAGH